MLLQISLCGWPVRFCHNQEQDLQRSKHREETLHADLSHPAQSRSQQLSLKPCSDPCHLPLWTLWKDPPWIQSAACGEESRKGGPREHIIPSTQQQQIQLKQPPSPSMLGNQNSLLLTTHIHFQRSSQSSNGWGEFPMSATQEEDRGSGSGVEAQDFCVALPQDLYGY